MSLSTTSQNASKNGQNGRVKRGPKTRPPIPHVPGMENLDDEGAEFFRETGPKTHVIHANTSDAMNDILGDAIERRPEADPSADAMIERAEALPPGVNGVPSATPNPFAAETP